MAARMTPCAGSPGSAAEVVAGLKAEGLEPRSWGNGPGDRYGWHAHDYHKVLWCVEGGIVFHTDDGDLVLEPGDRLDVEPGTRHAATVGPAGCRCTEAPVPPGAPPPP